MIRKSLPPDVPVDNKAKLSATDAAPPDMAVPRFATSRASASNQRGVEASRRHAVPSEYEDDIEENVHRGRAPMPPAARQLALMIMIVALAGVLGAIVYSLQSDGLPLCSTQPEWNQYNCRVK